MMNEMLGFINIERSEYASCLARTQSMTSALNRMLKCSVLVFM